MKGGDRSYVVGNSSYYWNAENVMFDINRTTFAVQLYAAGQAPVLLETFTSLVEAENFVQTLR